ncbi:MAG: hypothetical protein DYG86_15995 [Chloroflexi bacterium CFX2]|nr:hypothetical protein [Chloroflexi bacterium CFX2]
MLMPTILKIGLALTLFVIFSIVWSMVVPFVISDTFPLGFPFPIILAWGPCPPGENCSEFSTINLIVDAVIWYFIGAWLGSRFQKKR